MRGAARRARATSRSPASPTTAARCAPGDAVLLRARLPQRRPRLRRRRRSQHGAAALVVERPLGLGVPEVLVRLRARGDGAARRALLRRSDARAAGRRRHRHERQDDDRLPRARAARGGRRAVRAARHGQVGGRRRTSAPVDAHDARGDRPAGATSARCSTAATAPARWRSPRTRSSSGAPTAIHFAAAVFTNLTQDHLDFHATMEDYFQAKRRLFVRATAPPACSVVNVDDPYGRRLAAELDGRASRSRSTRAADYSATRPALRLRAAAASRCARPTGEREVALPMPGRFNVANALGALAAAHALGVRPRRRSSAALERGVRVPGPLRAGRRGPGLRGARRLRPHARLAARTCCAPRASCRRGGARASCVFGAGGDRDRGKRPLMGEIAARLADVVDRHLRQPALGGPRARSSPRSWPASRARGAEAVAASSVDRRARDRARRSPLRRAGRRAS